MDSVCINGHICNRPCRFRATTTVIPAGTSHADTNHYLAIPQSVLAFQKGSLAFDRFPWRSGALRKFQVFSENCCLLPHGGEDVSGGDAASWHHFPSSYLAFEA